MYPRTPSVLEALTRADKQFIQCLTAEERSRIHATRDLNTLVMKTKEFAEELRRQGNLRGGFSLQMVGEKAILLEPLERLVEGAAKLSPKGGEMIWGSIIFVLEMVKNNARALSEASEFFENFANEVQYMDLQNQMFSASPLVQSAMEHLYVAILNLWVAAVNYYRGKTGGLRERVKTFITSSIVQKGFDMLKAEIAAQKIRLHDATTAEHNAESLTFHANSMAFQQTMRQRELKKWLNAPDYEQDRQDANDLRYEGTCEWISRKQPYIDLGMSSSSLFLYIHGIPGSGKTVLSSWIINKLQNAPGTGLLLYHYFKDTDANKRTPLDAVRSFVDQLHDYLRNTHNPLLLAALESNLEKASLDRSGHVGYVDLWKIFSASLSALASALFQQSLSQTIVFVMDAMDECQSPSALISDLSNLAKTHPDQICILVTGRKSALDMIQRSSSSSHTPLNELEITIDDVHADIQAFVRHTISTVPRLSGDPALRNRLIAEIGRDSNHQGMFLWAFFMCEEVGRQGDPVALQRLLEHPPKGLDAMYGRICHAIIEKDKGLGFSLSVLQWIVNSPRSLRFSELQDGLRLMQLPLSAEDAWFDQTSDLLWSRQDIVNACGNLVTYTGAAGDSFHLVHLSAKQFFHSDLDQGNGAVLPESIRLFRDNIRNAQFKLASLCLQYLLPEELLFHEYLSISATFTSSPAIKKADFVDKFPLFHFAVSYWPRFVLDGLPAQHGDTSIPTLARVFTSFKCSSAVIIWFVHAIKGLGIAIVMDQVQQLAANVGIEDPSLMLITTWACKAFDRMNTYYEQISRWPELIIKCWPMETMLSKTASLARTWQNVWPEVISKATTQTAQRFPQSTWFHYDPQKDLLFGLDDRPICLRVHSLKSGASMRAGLVPPHHGMPRNSPLRAAVVSPSSRFVAAIFDTKYGGESDLHPVLLVCWRLPGGASHGVSGISDAFLKIQPDVILCEQYNTVLCSTPHPSEYILPRFVDSRLAFVGDNMLLTPRGIRDLRKKEWLSDSGLDLTTNDFNGLYFSGNGGRAARISIDESGNKFSLFNIQDRRLAYASGLKWSDDPIHPLAFSHSGHKIVFYRQLLRPTKMAGACPKDKKAECTGYGHRFSCLIADEQYTVELHTPHHLHVWKGTKAQFSNNEETIVADVYYCPGYSYQEVRVIAVWKLIRDAKGRYTEASFTCYYKQWYGFFQFCLVPAFDNDPERVFLVTHGIVEQRALDQIWSAAEEAAFWDEDHVTESVNVDPKLKTIVVKTLRNAGNEKTLAQSKKWSFGSLPPQLRVIMTSTSILDIPLKNISQRSNAYFATDQALIRVFDGDTALEQHERSQVLLYTETRHIMASAFSANDDFFVLLHHNPRTQYASYGMTVYQNIRVHDGSLLATTQIASSEVDLSDHIRNTHFILHFNPVNSSHFLLIICDHNPNVMVTMRGKSRVMSFELPQLGVSNDICFPQEKGYYTCQLRFSPCGTYLLAGRQGLFADSPPRKSFPRVLALAQKNSSKNKLHPVIMEPLQQYIHNHCVFLFCYEFSIIRLFRASLFGEVKLWAERVICVLPRQADDGGFYREFLIWPEDDEEEVTIVLAGRDGDPFVIETGILSRDLLAEDAWSIKEQGLKEASLRTESDEEMDGIDCEDETVSDEEMSGVDGEDETESDGK